MKYTGERFIPNSDGVEIEAEHVHRYTIISDYLKGMNVLDAGCGTGYGSLLISQLANTVVGIDISSESVEWCNERYATQENLSFIQASLESLPFEDGEFDCIVSLEVIEHVDKNIQESFLKEAKRVLNENGVLIISTPNKYIYTDKSGYHNPYHIHEFYPEEFKAFLYQEFGALKIYNQSLYAVSSISDENPTDHEVRMLKKADLDSTGKYMVAICANNVESLSVFNLNSVYKYDNPLGINISSLYTAVGEGLYSQEHKKSGILIVDETNQFSVTFDISGNEGIKQFRFDPIEDCFCICSIEEILTDGLIESSVPLNALEYHRQGFLFMNIDPQFELRGVFEQATYITLKGYFKVLSQVEVSEFVDIFYNKMMNAINASNNTES
ncbi:class I SAM-dependent methyltransferase [Paenibacillus sp. TY11]|uniref:class I SAM-dependent methyltransferase n=1 Tax=Paenibacillus sp. TY11 TaxID=3448633 RepID=UPI004039C2AC